jgi:hypothetical protein
LKAVDDLFEREVNDAVKNDIHEEGSSSDEESSIMSAPKYIGIKEQSIKMVVEEEVKNDE